MLDIRFIREHADQVQQIAVQKGIALSVPELLETDEKRRELLGGIEALRKERNRISQAIPRLMKEKKDEEIALAKLRAGEVNAELGRLEERHEEVNGKYEQLMLLVPNVVSPDTPVGASDADNVEIRRWGTVPEFDFAARDHVALGEALHLFDIPRGVKVGGTRSYFLKGAGAHLHRAVQQLAIDFLHERGYTIMDVPLIARGDALAGTGFFPTGREQTYQIDEEDKWLVGTSEVPLISYYAGEIIDVNEPIRLAGVSNCFRKEAGSAGRDVRGLYRVHQFAKVEQVVLCRDDHELAERLLLEMLDNAEQLLRLLELPYRIVAVCTGDLSQKNYKQYDIETWMPSRGHYGETHSASNVTDFQARRSGIRYRDENGQTRCCFTLNNTAVATPRILIPLLENHQREDGSVYVPAALRKYMHGLEELK
ncbi:serine--tRNA ligase [Paenibacillus sp. MBLB4367]|uniref:serine--tRNA ligase n=1 Tax=Paenibacillus sp. MBLB4367 TaxID=3384767 RepID=UPI00390827FD